MGWVLQQGRMAQTGNCRQNRDRMVDCMSKVMLHTVISCWPPFLGLALVAVFVGSTLGCPSRCECSAQTKAVVCHRKRMPSIPDGIPTETRILDLSKNKLTMINPDDFLAFPGLEELDLNHVPPNTLHGLNLTALFITNTNLSSFPYQALKHLPYVTHLNLSFNRIRHIEGGMLMELVRLRELHLVGAQLTTIEPYAFQGLRGLKVLNVSHNRLDTLEKGVFQSPEALEVLLIDNNPLVCDCRLMWILQRRHSIFFGDSQPECSTPEGIRGRPFKEFEETLLSYYVTCTKPKIHENKTQTITVDEGQQAVLRCSAEGTPRPIVSWLSPRRRVLTSRSHGRVTLHNNGTLEIKSAAVQDSGVYLCLASNSAGNDTLMTSLAVKSLGSLYANRTQYYTDPSNTTVNGTAVSGAGVWLTVRSLGPPSLYTGMRGTKTGGGRW
ncbi:hypothetical protein FQN60_010004, partial [Etheostoma spectabile]